MALIVKSTRERVVKLFIATVLCLGLAAWCWYDAFYKESMKESSRQFNLYAIPVLIVLAVVGLFYALKAARLRIKADELPPDEVLGRYAVVEGPDAIVATYAPLVTEVHADIVTVQITSLDQEATIGMLGTEVLPRLRAIG